MSNDPFPERVVARKLCQMNGAINSTLSLDKLPRLGEYLHDKHGQVEVRLSFDRDEGGADVIIGSVNAVVNLQCQRCLEPTPVKVHSDIIMRVANDEDDAAKLTRMLAETAVDRLQKLDIVVCDEGELDLIALVEDELILSLPIVASHNNEQCNDRLNKLREQAGKIENTNIKGLDVLEKLKQELADKQNND